MAHKLIPAAANLTPLAMSTDGTMMATAFKLSEMLSKSDMVPKGYRNKPANVMLAHLAGLPFGWEVTMAMRSFHIIEGIPTLKPEVQLGLVRQAGHSVNVTKSDATGTTLVGRRADTGDSATVSYTIDDARQAGLLGKQTWKAFPEDMSFARAVARLNRRLFQDVLLGCAYVPEEIENSPFSNSNEAPTEVIQLRQGRNAAAAEDVDLDADHTDGPAPAKPVAVTQALIDTEYSTPAQIKLIHTLKGELGLDDERYRGAIEHETGQRSSKDLTAEQASCLIELLQAKASKNAAPAAATTDAATEDAVVDAEIVDDADLEDNPFA